MNDEEVIKSETVSVQHQDDEILPELDIPFLLTDRNAIKSCLGHMVEYDMEKIENIQERVNDLDLRIEYYKRFILNENAESDTDKLVVARSSSKNFPQLGMPRKTLKNNEMTIENIHVPRFEYKKFSNLPNNIEPAQLMKSLSMKMNFRDSFLKYWIPVIRSEASCGILIDSFWWFLLKHFKKDPSLEPDIYKYFCRISESFAALFFSIDSSFRDMFFDNYANFLTQAIYLTFYQAFPGSRLHLNDNFKRELCQTIYEWVLGVNCFPNMYKEWVINDQIQSATADSNAQSLTTNQLLSKVSSLQKKLNTISESDEPKVGEYFKFEKNSFNLKGKSMLIDQYFKMYNLDPLQSMVNKIDRSEVAQ